MIIPMMKTVDISKAAEALAQYVDDPNKPGIIVMSKRKPIVVVLPVHGADVETVSVSFHPGFNELMRQSGESLARHGGISSEELRKEFGLPPFSEPKPRKQKTKTVRRNRKANGAANGGQV